jgi:hypothetical protein
MPVPYPLWKQRSGFGHLLAYKGSSVYRGGRVMGLAPDSTQDACEGVLKYYCRLCYTSVRQ